MTSILTNSAAIGALQTLRSINSQMEATQSRISTGYRVANASDDAAYWSIATTMLSDNKALSAVEDALSLGAATLDTAYTGMDAAIEVMDEVKAKLVVAREPGVDKTKINKELTQLKGQLRSIVDSATFNGENWLKWNTAADSVDKSLVSSFTRGENGLVTVGTTTYTVSTGFGTTGINYLVDNGGTGEYGILTSKAFATSVGAGSAYVLFKGAANPPSTVEMVLNQTTTDVQIDDMINTVDAMLQRMIDVASNLGALQTGLELKGDFVADLRDSIETGVGRLMDADMNEESTRLKALQTQHQLGLQSLSIANNNAQNLLSLFR
ncbi:flagellin [Hoeflea sp. AS60]|uniref:flagellin N-terminal helical domain-containing protein n=1 Tax=Hoeflea sp. AS60 TaxID=3135780 RepID=UPI003173D803